MYIFFLFRHSLYTCSRTYSDTIAVAGIRTRYKPSHAIKFDYCL